MRERFADRPPRPLADAPTAPLSDGADELARDWLVELLARLPLPEVASLDLEPLATGAPDVCRAVVAALADDEALAALRRGGALESQLSGVCTAAAGGRAAAIPAAVESLRRVVWAAALGALAARPPAELVAALSDRLAHVCASVCATALGAIAATAAVDGPSAGATTAPDGPNGTPPFPEFVVHDARGAAESTPDARGAAQSTPDARGAADATPAGDGWNAELVAALAGEEVRSLMLVDVDGRERLLASDGRAALQHAERALVRNLVDDATMVRECLGRYWVASGCGNDGAATEFARRLAEAVADGPGHHGVPLTASIGFTLLDDPGGERRKPNANFAAELCERAEEAMLSARAAGAGVDSR